MKSKIILGEVVDNKDPKFGATSEYYPALIEDADGVVHNALFTDDQLNVAMERADKNPEDIPEKTFWGSLFNK